MPGNELMKSCLEERGDFELFKSNTCHRLKSLGDIKFLITMLEEDEIRKYYDKAWYRESLYLLAMLDYISRENGIPICTKYNDLRTAKLERIVFPTSVVVAANIMGNDEPKQQALKEAIPEFMRFNIVESEVRNVV